MSRPHHGHRSFFPVGNPFRVILPGGPHLSRKLQELLTSYEDALALSLRKLKPEAASEVLTLSWMRVAVDCLSELHTNIGTLITELELPVLDWDEKWVDIYLNSSVKLLDICIALSSELLRLDHGQLLVQYVLHVLDCESGVPSREQFKRAEASLREWMERVDAMSPRLERCSTALQELAGNLCLTKVKNSAKGKVLMRALYGIEAVTVFICSVFVAALSSSSKPLVEFHVPEKFGWSQAFDDLHTTISGELRRQLSRGSVAAVKELAEVEARAKRLHVLTINAQLEEEIANLAGAAVSHSKEVVMSESTAQEGDREDALRLDDDTSRECEVFMSESITEEGTQEAEMKQDTKTISYANEATMLEKTSEEWRQDNNIKQANGISDENSTVAPERTSVLEGREELMNCISSMSKSAEGLRLGLDSLSKRVGDFFQIVLTGRDALLCNLRISDATSKVAETDPDVHAAKTEQISEMMGPPAARGERKRKGTANLDMHGYGNSELHDSNDNANESFRSESERLGSRSGYAVQDSNGDFGGFERVKVPLSSCTAGSKKHKGKVEVTSLDDHGEYAPSGPKVVENIGSSKKKGKKKPEIITEAVTVAEPAPVEPENNVVVVEPEKPQKKYVPITPTIHTGFSFSIVHLLTAVRKAMVTPTEDTPVAAKQSDGEESRKWFNNDENSKMPQEPSATEQAQQGHEVADASSAEQTVPSNLPALTVQELVGRIRSNPGDPNILETQEPLQDLVRGVLKILSSRTAPLGAKGWKALVSYDKSNKSWFWVGPLPSGSSDGDPNEETAAEAWGIPHKMLVKLVDAFANWLKSGQETLKQIGSLPPPPPPNPANLDLKERFKDLRAQKSLNTISPSSEEARSYFQREEFLRYSIPDRAFCYTAADGEKSIVAPLRRGGGKPTAKARGHPMLLPDRPPHVTILCLVRDAAARLPARTGTRADVCTLLKDSQYLNHEESNKEAAINQVVSGALDRLHYERDPCVLYDNDKKLWTYLHRGREEEDFEDDGTSSTKKWKRPRKEPSDPAEPGAANDDLEDDGTPSTNNVKKQKKVHDLDPTASGEDKDGGDHAIQDPSAGGFSGGFEGDPDLNVPSSINDEERGELVCTDARSDFGSSRASVDATTGSRADGNSASWQGFPEQNNNMALPEDSRMEFHEGLDREGSKGLMNATLL